MPRRRAFILDGWNSARKGEELFSWKDLLKEAWLTMGAGKYLCLHGGGKDAERLAIPDMRVRQAAHAGEAGCPCG